MAYVVRKNGRVIFSGKTFKTYEKARQALRKLIRSKFKPHDLARDFDFGVWDSISRNPSSYTDAGYSIRAV